MKKHLIIIILVFAIINIYGQKTNYIVQLNSGLFKFNGISVEGTEKINCNIIDEEGYTNNPYGNRPTLSYGISLGFTRIYKSNLRFGFDLSYEILKSKINIDGVWVYNNIINETVNAIGQTYLNFNFVNAYPSIGYQHLVSNINIYIDIGIEYGYCIKAYEKGYAKSNLREFKTRRDRKTISSDIRPRIQIGIEKNRIGGYIGYSKGLLNYKSGYIGGTNEAFSNMIRIGLKFQLNKWGLKQVVCKNS